MREIHAEYDASTAQGAWAVTANNNFVDQRNEYQGVDKSLKKYDIMGGLLNVRVGDTYPLKFLDLWDDDQLPTSKWMTLSFVTTQGFVFVDEHYLLQPRPFRLVQGYLNGSSLLTVAGNLRDLNALMDNMYYGVPSSNKAMLNYAHRLKDPFDRAQVSVMFSDGMSVDYTNASSGVQTRAYTYSR
jgi:hypothetical protein